MRINGRTLPEAQWESDNTDGDAQTSKTRKGLFPPRVALRFKVVCGYLVPEPRGSETAQLVSHNSDVGPVQSHAPRCQTRQALLTIRLLPLRYFSTSYKLLTETLALGIIVRGLRALRGPGGSSLHGRGKFTSYALSRFHV